MFVCPKGLFSKRSKEKAVQLQIELPGKRKVLPGFTSAIRCTSPCEFIEVLYRARFTDVCNKCRICGKSILGDGLAREAIDRSWGATQHVLHLSWQTSALLADLAETLVSSLQGINKIDQKSNKFRAVQGGWPCCWTDVMTALKETVRTGANHRVSSIDIQYRLARLNAETNR